jgi:hypothetical protein
MVLTAALVVIAVFLLGLYAMRSKVRFKCSATLLRWFSVQMEIDTPGQERKAVGPGDGDGK